MCHACSTDRDCHGSATGTWSLHGWTRETISTRTECGWKRGSIIVWNASVQIGNDLYSGNRGKCLFVFQSRKVEHRNRWTAAPRAHHGLMIIRVTNADSGNLGCSLFSFCRSFRMCYLFLFVCLFVFAGFKYHYQPQRWRGFIMHVLNVHALSLSIWWLSTADLVGFVEKRKLKGEGVGCKVRHSGLH